MCRAVAKAMQGIVLCFAPREPETTLCGSRLLSSTRGGWDLRVESSGSCMEKGDPEMTLN